MGSQSLEEAVQAAEDPVRMLREAGGRWIWPDDVAREYTNWMDELRAVRETCVLADLTHHQMDQIVEGPDALDLLTHLCTNSFDDFAVGSAKQAVMCNPHGDFIGDGVLQRVDAERFVLSGKSPAAHWLAYHLDVGDYDATERIYPKSSETDDDPHLFTYQVQGPNALDVLQRVTDVALDEVPFFDFAELSVAGTDVRALRHGMAGEAGFELQGPYEHGEAVREALLDAGEPSGIRRLGTRAYEPLSVYLGWITGTVVPVFGYDDMADYRRWLDADGYEGTSSIAGSFWSDDVRDYYLSPVELGYEHLLSFDHDFVGREALEAEVEEPSRTRVTLVWDDDDFADIFASLVGDGTPYRLFDLPRDRWGAQFDEVRRDGSLIGFSKSFAYSLHDREMVSLGCLDVEYAEPGTEVTILWGESGESPNPTVAPHAQTELRATVAPTPYLDDKR